MFIYQLGQRINFKTENWLPKYWVFKFVVHCTIPPPNTHNKSLNIILPFQYNMIPRARIFKRLMEPRNRFQGMNSASLCSLAGRYDNHSYSVPCPHRLLKNSSSEHRDQEFVTPGIKGPFVTTIGPQRPKVCVRTHHPLN
jgi:hypothetical protein